jgi:hypothetical protein
MECTICKTPLIDPSKAGVSSRNIAVLKDYGKCLCIACDDVYGFIDSLDDTCDDKVKEPKKVSEPKVPVVTLYTCTNLSCRKKYEGRACSHCGTPNILFIRRTKKKKRRRKKK